MFFRNTFFLKSVTITIPQKAVKKRDGKKMTTEPQYVITMQFMLGMTLFDNAILSSYNIM